MDRHSRVEASTLSRDDDTAVIANVVKKTIFCHCHCAEQSDKAIHAIIK